MYYNNGNVQDPRTAYCARRSWKKFAESPLECARMYLVAHKQCSPHGHVGNVVTLDATATVGYGSFYIIILFL